VIYAVLGEITKLHVPSVSARPALRNSQASL
jgi:hypothetical protein